MDDPNPDFDTIKSMSEPEFRVWSAMKITNLENKITNLEKKIQDMDKKIWGVLIGIFLVLLSTVLGGIK